MKRKLIMRGVFTRCFFFTDFVFVFFLSFYFLGDDLEGIILLTIFVIGSNSIWFDCIDLNNDKNSN